MAARDQRVKVAYEIAESAKIKLEKLKTKLRKAGMARREASEVAILESLIKHADFEALLSDLNR